MVQEQYQQAMSRSSRHTRQLARRLSKLTEVQAAVGWGLILLVIALLGVIYLNQSSRIAAVGRRVQTLQYDLSVLQRENADIEREIAQSQSIIRIQEEASRMGFVTAQPGNIEYLVVPNYPSVALVTEEEVQTSVEPSSIESMKGGLWLVIETGLNELMRGESREQ
jgi:cell division protein FtsL